MKNISNILEGNTTYRDNTIFEELTSDEVCTYDFS